MAADVNSRNAVVRARLCFSALDAPITGQGGAGEPRYRATLCISKEAKGELQKLTEAAKNAYLEKFGKEAYDRRGQGWSGINDGDTRTQGPDGIHDGCYYVNCKSKNPPILIDEAKEYTTKIYDGCIVNARIFAYTYEYAGKRGVGYGFSALQFVEDGTKIERRNNNLDAFEVLKPKAQATIVTDQEIPGDNSDEAPVSDSEMDEFFM